MAPRDDDREVQMIADKIFNRFETYWLETIGNVAVATTSKQIWLDLAFSEELGGRFGWCWPAPYSDPEKPEITTMIAYCPELLAEITAHLDEEDRDCYLDAVEFLCSMFIAAEAADPLEAQVEVLELLADRFPSTTQLMDDVEERAVALGLVPNDGVVSTDRVCTSCGYVNEAGTADCVLCAGPL